MKIIVNGNATEVEGEEISYDDVVRIAYNGRVVGSPSITFHQGAGPSENGTLPTGGTVRIKEGTVFNVASTGNG
jgi:hypothetical protein